MKATNNTPQYIVYGLSPETDEIARRLGLTVDHMTQNGRRNFYYYRDQNGQDIRNHKGETLTIEVQHCLDAGGPHSLAASWHKEGHTPQRLAAWWSLCSFVYNEAGECYAAYNPQTMPSPDGRRLVVNFEWMEHPTPDSFERLLRETLRRFNAAK